MKVNIKPLADRVLVKPLEAETKTASGIIIPDNAKEKPQKAIVVAVGTGNKDHKMTVKVGDTVLYGKYSGTELKFDGMDYLIIAAELRRQTSSSRRCNLNSWKGSTGARLRGVGPHAAVRGKDAKEIP